MRKYLYLSAAALVALFGASCSQEEMPEVQPEDGLTTFRVSIPQESLTRAYGDGLTATKLYVAIYDDGNMLRFSNFSGSTLTSGLDVSDFATDAAGKITATVKVPLVKNAAYQIVCWAQDPEVTAYTYDSTAKSINVDYSELANYSEGRDAFFGILDLEKSTGAGGNITLTRAMAQVNIGTNDYTQWLNAGGSDAGFGMTITGASKTLSLTDGAVTNEVTDAVTYTPVAAKEYSSSSEFNFPLATAENPYTYLAMGYALVGTQTGGQVNVDVALTDANGNTLSTYNSVPVRMNYRTNIYGQLLTNSEQFTVTINPEWGGSFNQDLVVAKKGQTLQEIVSSYNGNNAYIVLDPGTEYTVTGVNFKRGANYTFDGGGTATLNIVSTPAGGVGTVVLNNLNVKFPDNSYNGFQGNNVEYNNCTISGSTFLYSTKTTFTDCTFNQNGNYYPLWTYGSGDVTVNKCIFNCAGSAKAILVYGDTENLVYNITVNDCTFNCAEGCAVTDKGAIEIHTERYPTYAGATVIINNTSVIPSQFGGGLWREWYNKDNEHATDYCKVIVNGVVVQQGHATE